MFATQKAGLGRVFATATAEAKRCGDRFVGTEHLTLALLADPDSLTAKALGVDLAWARSALLALDHEALAALGVDATFDEPITARADKDRLRLTPGAKAVFGDLRAQSKGERLGILPILLLALLDRQPPDPAAALLDTLGVDRAEVQRRLRAA